jgi:hypothetical protein
MNEPINKDTLRYLANQQRMAFKEGWESELKSWVIGWDDKLCEELAELNNADEFLSYLYKKSKKNSWDYEYLYYNFEGQHKEDREEMFNDMKETLNEILEEKRLYANGEL